MLLFLCTACAARSRKPSEEVVESPSGAVGKLVDEAYPPGREAAFGLLKRLRSGHARTRRVQPDPIVRRPGAARPDGLVRKPR